MVYKQPRAGAGERCTKRQAERNSSGCGGGEHTVIFLVLKSKHELEGQAYLLSAYSRNL